MQKCLFKSLAYFLNGVAWLLLLDCRSHVIYLILTPYQIHNMQIIVSQHASSLHSIDRVLGCTEFFNLVVMPFIFCFPFCCLCFGYHIQAEKSLPNPMSWNFPPMSSSRSFVVLGLNSEWIKDANVIFVYGENRVWFHSFACAYPVFPIPRSLVFL